MVRMKKSSSRAASPLAQAEERISNRVQKKPIDMCYKGPAESQSQSAGSGGGEGAEKSHRHCVIRAQRRASGEKNGTSTSRRSRVRYAPCPINSSTQPADARKGDLQYPVPDATPGVDIHDSSPWKEPGVVVEKKLSPYHYWVRMKAVISVVNYDRMKACHAR